MKKILLVISMFLFAFSASASSITVDKKYAIENISLEVKENIGYNEKLDVNYSINPLDASNTKLVWSITGLKEGVSATIESGNETNSNKGTLTLSIDNSTDKDVVLKLVAKQNGKVLVTKELNVESKDTTNDRLKEEVTRMIKSLDEKIDKDNYESIKETIDKVDSLLDEDVKKLIDSEFITKFENVKSSMSLYEQAQGKTLTIIISIVLVILFIIGMVLIFKKEDK